MQYDYIAVIVYTTGAVGWIFLWHYLVGFRLMNRMRLLHLAFWGGLFVFFVNILLGFLAKVPEYDIELQLYSYVERNATTVAGLSLAIAVFIVFSISSNNIDKGKPLIKLFLWLILWAFLLSVLGCLTLYWMPSSKYWLTALRHIKSVPFFYSLFILAAGIIVFMYEIGYSRSMNNEIEEELKNSGH
ncbi:MAG: hypothetical protein WCU00_10780 [Candidatus Latescibacterota bacterium]